MQPANHVLTYNKGVSSNNQNNQVHMPQGNPQM